MWSPSRTPTLQSRPSSLPSSSQSILGSKQSTYKNELPDILLPWAKYEYTSLSDLILGLSYLPFTKLPNYTRQKGPLGFTLKLYLKCVREAVNGGCEGIEDKESYIKKAQPIGVFYFKLALFFIYCFFNCKLILWHKCNKNKMSNFAHQMWILIVFSFSGFNHNSVKVNIFAKKVDAA